MAQVAQGSIKVGSSRIVGRVQVDAGLVRGEGGPFEPRLVVPIGLELQARPAGQMLAIPSLTAYLHLGDINNAAHRIGAPAIADLLRGLPVRSLPSGSDLYVIELRFQLSLPTVFRIEAYRHASSEDVLTFALRLDAPLVWVNDTYGEYRVSPHQQVATPTDDPFQGLFGLHSRFSYFWSSDIDALLVRIEPSVWISQVLPGLGVDNIRLVEVVFPPGLPDVGNAARVFDEALSAFHARRYEDCIGKCRGIVQAWNRQLSASKKQRLPELVGDTQMWPADDPRRSVLDALWSALVDAGNVPHHPDSQEASYKPTAHDARLHLMMTAVISEYLQGVLASRYSG